MEPASPVCPKGSGLLSKWLVRLGALGGTLAAEVSQAVPVDNTWEGSQAWAAEESHNSGSVFLIHL